MWKSRGNINTSKCTRSEGQSSLDSCAIRVILMLSTGQTVSAFLRCKGTFTVKITLHMFLIPLLQKYLEEIHQTDLLVYLSTKEAPLGPM